MYTCFKWKLYHVQYTVLLLSAGCRQNSPAEKRRFPAGFLAGDESVKHNSHFNPSLSCLNLIFSRQPNFLATTLNTSSLRGWRSKGREGGS